MLWPQRSAEDGGQSVAGAVCVQTNRIEFYYDRHGQIDPQIQASIQKTENCETENDRKKVKIGKISENVGKCRKNMNEKKEGKKNKKTNPCLRRIEFFFFLTIADWSSETLAWLGTILRGSPFPIESPAHHSSQQSFRCLPLSLLLSSCWPGHCR